MYREVALWVATPSDSNPGGRAVPPSKLEILLSPVDADFVASGLRCAAYKLARSGSTYRTYLMTSEFLGDGRYR